MLENLPAGIHEGRLVIHKQYPSMPRAGNRFTPFDPGFILFHDRQADIKGASLSLFTVYGNGTFITGRNAPGHSQTQAAALPMRLGGKIGFEYFIQNFRIDAAARVADRYFQIFSRSNVKIKTGRSGFNLQLIGFQFQYTAVFLHCIPGIGAQVDQHLMNFCSIRHHVFLITFQVLADFNGGRQCRPQQFDDFLDNWSYKYGLGPGSLVAAEAQNLFYQISSATAGPDDIFKIVVKL